MTEKSKRLPFAEIRETAEFQRLTPKQQLFIEHYIEGGMFDGHYDVVAATRTAYECKKPETARIMSYAMMANIRIIAVLNLHFNAEPVEEFLRLLDRAIYNKKLTIAQMEALRLKSDILGLVSRVPGKQRALGTLPQSVIEAEDENKKAKPRKPRVQAEKPVVKSEDDEILEFLRLPKQ